MTPEINDDAREVVHSQNNPVAKDGQNGDLPAETDKDAAPANPVFQIEVALPHKPYKLPIMVSIQEQVHDLRQSIVEQHDTFQYSCFHLEHNGEHINDFVELSEVKDLEAGSELKLVEDPYTEKEARLHTIRIRDLIGASGNRIDIMHGLSAGISLLDSIPAHSIQSPNSNSMQNGLNGSKSNTKSGSAIHPVAEYDFDSPPSIQTLLPPRVEPPPKTVKALTVSPWNPPPPPLRQKGHLLYLQLTTNEGEQFQISSHTSGFFVNRSSNAKFDPFPRPGPKNVSAHSLLSLISKLSPSFETSFLALQEYNGKKDPLVNFQITNAIPANPWVVAPSASSLSAHLPDMTRTQEAYLISGIENTETLRDWNEEFQSTRELPKETVQDRVFRERLTSKLFADYNDAAVRGAILCARGEIAPLNPTEQGMSQIFVYNNIFYSFGADGVGTFGSEGGDPAARVAVGRDVAGVRLVNQLDIEGLFTPGTVIVDYLGKRLVCQSLVPGIFKQREPEEHQVNYGGVEGRDVIAEDEAFVPVFSKLSKALRVKRHDVWDKDGKKHTLEGSVETKGMLGTDGRRYVLDLYRLTPPDIEWMENYWSDSIEGQPKRRGQDYPHRMGVLRPELVEAFWRLKMTEYVSRELQRRKKDPKVHDSGTKSLPNGQDSINVDPETEGGPETEGDPVAAKDARVDVSGFSFTLNPDVCCGQTPQSDEEKKELAQDEQDARDACRFLRDTAIPEFIKDLDEGDVGFPMDGQSLSRLMHKRGINIRYLGNLADLTRSRSSRLSALSALAAHEIVARSFKHVCNGYLQTLPATFATPCISHLLNCLLGTQLNKSPRVSLDEDLQSFFPEADWSFAQVDPSMLQHAVEEQAHQRFRYTLEQDWVSKIKHIQLLREICLKLGIQLVAKDYRFVHETESATTRGSPLNSDHLPTNMLSKKKKKHGEGDPMRRSTESLLAATSMTFEADDIVNLVPVIKESSSRSLLAEEALEAGRISLAQNQKDLGQELLLESLSLHEQIYGILHPEVARVYHQLSMLYYQLDIKDAAAELAHKAVVLSERTLGLDHNETILSYLNLGLFEHANGNTEFALHCIRHALELWKIVYGLKHPDSITTMNNAAVMLQSLKQYHASRIWFEKSLAISEEVSGKDSVNTGTLCFQLAQALALDQDAKASVNCMKTAYNIFLAKLGPEDRNTKESESWLEQLTQNAVSIAKHAKDMQNRRLRRIQLTPKVTLGTRPQPQVGQSSSEMNAISGRNRAPSVGIDGRSVDELIRFIEGGGDSTKSTSRKRTQHGNPKRRGPKTPGSATAAA